MPLAFDGNARLSALLSQMQTAMGGDLANGGALMVLQSEEPTSQTQVGTPRVVFHIETDTTSRWNGANGTLRDLVAPFEVSADDFNGALVGVANPEAMQIRLARFLRDYIFSNRLPLHQAGWMMPEILLSGEKTGENEGMVMGKLHFTYNEAG